MDIAIHFEKVNLDDEKCFFKPLNVIKGTYNRESNMFTSESGLICYSLDSSAINENDYFYLPTTLDELKKAYGDLESEEVLFTEYLYMCRETFYVGIYNPEWETEVYKIPVAFLESDKSSEVLTYDNYGYTFNEAYLKSIRDSSSLEEVREKLNNIISIKEHSDDNVLFYEVGQGEKEGNEANYKLDKEESKKFDLARLRKSVLSQIISQDAAVNSVTSAIVVNHKSKNPRHKSHILIAGPSGAGKTEMINIITKELGIPYFKADATAYTKEGYVGKSVYSMLKGLIDSAGGDVEAAQNGILVIDEIDKKAGGGKDDVAGEAVLTSLLKIMDRGVIELNSDYYNTSQFDTTNLTIIFMGAFSEMFEQKNSTKMKSVGFANAESKEKKEITNQDFINYGMPAEFMGRIGTVAFTNELTTKDLVTILYKSKISPLNEEKEFFEDLGVTLKVTSGYIDEIAKMSSKSKTGARDLKKNVKATLLYAYDDVLLNPEIKTLKLTKKTALNPKDYYTE